MSHLQKYPSDMTKPIKVDDRVKSESGSTSAQQYEGPYEKLSVSYRQSAELLYPHLHELNGFENEHRFNDIKINDKLYNATDLLTDLVSNKKSQHAIDSNILNLSADSNFPLSLIRNERILKYMQNLRRISSEQVTESGGSFASVNYTVLESPRQPPIKSGKQSGSLLTRNGSSSTVQAHSTGDIYTAKAPL
ncbi:hypothetical protein QYM36_017517 [Artemia franciscana]|uniref:Uncharacterized protein n=1 Tax=Artemia franciscana TaxID=6661 RepID=A0AA88KVR5_ARTSF|nr:hypothetical protein QYM36_017517 [Artemia franciscana]